MAFWGAVIAGGVSLVGSILSSDAASDNAAAAAKASQLQYDIADRIQNREEELFDLWRDNYRDGELRLANETFAMPAYLRNDQTMALRAVVQVRRQFTGARRDALRGLKRFAVGAATGVLRDIALAEAGAAAWAANAAVNAEDEKAYVRDASRREEQRKVTALAHGQYTDSSVLSVAGQIYGQVSANAAKAASGASSAAGYYFQKAASSAAKAVSAYNAEPAPPPTPPPAPPPVAAVPAPATDFSALDAAIDAADDTAYGPV